MGSSLFPRSFSFNIFSLDCFTFEMPREASTQVKRDSGYLKEKKTLHLFLNNQ